MTNEPFAVGMTTDLLITMIDENDRKFDIAVSVKPSHKLCDKRVLEKQKIEFTYWALKGVEFFIITEFSLEKDVSDNLEFIHQNYCTANQNDLSLPEGANIGLIQQHIINEINLSDGDQTVSELCKKINERHGCNPGVALAICYRMIAVRVIDINMTKLSVGPITNVSSLKKYVGG